MLLKFRGLRVLLALLFVAVALGSAGAQAHPAREFGKKKKVKGVDNFGEVTPTLFREHNRRRKASKRCQRWGSKSWWTRAANEATAKGK